jgi:hypothetical protein
MLPTVSAMRCAWQQLAHGDQHVQVSDPVVGAGSRDKTRLVPAVSAGPKGETRSLGAILIYPHKLDEDIGESNETTVEQLNWGIIQPYQLRLEENHVHTKVCNGNLNYKK